MPRVFFALWPEAEFCAQLLQAAAPALATAGGRALTVADLHVTLCFVGAAEEDAVLELCKRAQRITAAVFELQFAALEYWRGARVWAATAPAVPAAEALAQKLAIAAHECGLTPESKPLRPHVTLMRGVTQAPSTDLLHVALLPLPMTAARFWLAQSDPTRSQQLVAQPSRSARDEALPVRYRPLASWPLHRA